MYALADDEDFKYLKEYTWYILSTGNYWYAQRNIKLNNRWSVIKMHKEIMGNYPKDKSQIDHINGNTLDNQKSNLRWATRAENIRNSKIRIDNKTGFKGVSWDKSRKKWLACGSKNGIAKYIGRFNNILEAVQAYKDFALLNYREFSRL